jgi:hypothetical protein
MDLAISAPPSYSPVQESYLQQSAVAVQRRVATQRNEATSGNNERTQQRQDQVDPRREAARLAREAAASEPARAPGFKFEYEDATRIMNVQDTKGVLIYQVPTKGQLALLEATERSAARIEVTA